jgi:hypothetical protein
MPFSAGVFTRTDGVFTGSTVFQQERDASIDILALNLDTEAQDMADGLSTCLLKDGTQTVTANIPMSGFQFTGLGSGTARSSSITVAQVQDSAVTWCGTFGGTATALTATLAPAITAYATGMRVIGTAASTVTGAATIQLNGISSPPSVRKKMASGLVALTGGEWVAGQTISFTYDGTFWVLDDKVESQKGADITCAATIDLGASTGEYVVVTGSTGPVTSFGTIAAGVTRSVTFTGTPTLTYNAASLILPGALDIVVAAGDSLVAVSLGSGNWRVISYDRASGSAVSSGSTYSIKTANYTAVAGDRILADCTSTAWMLTLPASPANTDAPIQVKKVGANALTIGVNGKNIQLSNGLVSSANQEIVGTPGYDFIFAYRGTDAGGQTNVWNY